MAKHTIVYNEPVERVCKDTGEITLVNERKIIDVKVGNEEKFYMTFVEHMAPMFKLTYANDIKVLLKFCQLAEYETGVVHLSPARRLEMVVELDMQQSNVSKSIRRLKEKNLITGDNGAYTLNPVIFWKGKKSKRLELLRTKGLQVIFNFKFDEGGINE